MKSRPKYTAVCHFSCLGHRFATGDAVDHPIVLDTVLRYGDQFVATSTKRRSTATTTEAEPPAEADTNTTSPTEATP